MAHEYVEIAEIKSTLELNGESFADPDLERALTAASRGIEKLTRRRFWPDADATQVRYYTPAGCHSLRVDDLLTLTTLQTDPGGDGTFEETWTVNTDHVLEPLNAVADGEPWTKIVVHPNGGYRFPSGYPRSVKVTGKFGWLVAPEEIKQATMILATRLMVRARQAPFGVVSFGMEGAAHIARTDPDVMSLAGPYIRDRITVA